MKFQVEFLLPLIPSGWSQITEMKYTDVCLRKYAKIGLNSALSYTSVTVEQLY